MVLAAMRDIARERVRKRPGRREPRAVKRTKDMYPTLRIPRNEAIIAMGKGRMKWL
jgi:hypothetical protein